MNRSAKLMALVVLGAFLAMALSMPALSQEKKDKVPKLYIHKTTVEVGEFIEGKDIEYTFRVRNHGLAELNIVDVKPG
jgi:hypothetical protein